MLSMVFVMVVMSIASAQRISEVINEKSTLHNPTNPEYEIKDGSIDFNNVSFSYFDDQEEVNLKDINVHIKSGQTIGIIGGTGSAKSTFVQLDSYDYMMLLVVKFLLEVKMYVVMILIRLEMK